MGNCFQRTLLLKKRIPKRQTNDKTIVLLIVGLDNSGKTSISNYIAGDLDKSVLPTMGFRTLSTKYKSYCVKLYDLGGSSQIRPLWSKYYNQVHGLIYVVDANDTSKLQENKTTFGDLITHEHISGKPLLLLANKQDLTEAIDELDLVENLNVEEAANAMRCPTRVETCSCFYEREQSKNGNFGIMNGYRWLMDTITKNYTALNSRIETNQVPRRLFEHRNISTGTPPKSSINSNPFRPIKELLMKKEKTNTTNNSQNGVGSGMTLKNIFTHRNNKTAPLSIDNSNVEHEPQSLADRPSNTRVFQVRPTVSVISHTSGYNYDKPSRPHTAPENLQRLGHQQMTIPNIPGQVLPNWD